MTNYELNYVIQPVDVPDPIKVKFNVWAETPVLAKDIVFQYFKCPENTQGFMKQLTNLIVDSVDA